MFNVLVQNEDLTEGYVKLHVDKEIIKGYYISKDDVDNNTVNLITTCGGLNCLRNSKLMKWLENKFN